MTGIKRLNKLSIDHTTEISKDFIPVVERCWWEFKHQEY